jgi:hypothetical protein
MPTILVSKHVIQVEPGTNELIRTRALKEQNPMKWIDEMFIGMEKDKAKDKAAEPVRLAERDTKVEPAEHREKPDPGATEV